MSRRTAQWAAAAVALAFVLIASAVILRPVISAGQSNDAEHAPEIVMPSGSDVASQPDDEAEWSDDEYAEYDDDDDDEHEDDEHEGSHENSDDGHDDDDDGDDD